MHLRSRHASGQSAETVSVAIGQDEKQLAGNSIWVAAEIRTLCDRLGLCGFEN